MKWAGATAMLWAAVAGAMAQPSVPFASSTIDPANSGDCKALADIDRDGKADPVIGGHSLCWYESGASFAKHIIRSGPVYGEYTTDLQAADIDRDGDLDLALGDGSGPDNVLWFENPLFYPPFGQGSDPRIGSNWAMHTVGTHGDTVHDIEVADLDGDGQVEILTSGHGYTRLWKQVEPGTWSGRDLSSLAGAGIFIGDIDRDNRPDIATPFAWLRNPGDVLLGAWNRHPITGATTGDECLLVDLNADGRLDLLTCDAHTRSNVFWFEQPADPTSPSWPRRTLDPFMGSHHAETADFDGNGLPDVLLGLELSDVAVYLNRGGSPPVFEKEIVATAGGHNARAGDIDGDSLPDILACDYITNPPVRVFINDLEIGPACYVNCDQSASLPLVTGNDFQCFANAFAVGDPYANCDGSTAPPVLTANDFLCFLTRYAAGCR